MLSRELRVEELDGQRRAPASTCSARNTSPMPPPPMRSARRYLLSTRRPGCEGRNAICCRWRARTNVRWSPRTRVPVKGCGGARSRKPDPIPFGAVLRLGYTCVEVWDGSPAQKSHLARRRSRFGRSSSRSSRDLVCAISANPRPIGEGRHELRRHRTACRGGAHVGNPEGRAQRRRRRRRRCRCRRRTRTGAAPVWILTEPTRQRRTIARGLVGRRPAGGGGGRSRAASSPRSRSSARIVRTSSGGRAGAPRCRW